jgi:hypothetical protein
MIKFVNLKVIYIILTKNKWYSVLYIIKGDTNKC